MISTGPMYVGTRSSNELRSRLDWSIARLLREQYPDLRLRERVRNDPLLEKTKFGDLWGDPLRLYAFMEELRSLPQCGTTQLSRLRTVLLRELRTAEANALTAPQPLQLSVLSSVPSAADIVVPPYPAECTFHPDFVEAVEDVYFRMWRLAQFDPFVYIPTTLPEFAKIPEVLAVELESGRDLKGYQQRITSLRNTLERISAAEGLVLLDGQALQAVFLRQGRYANLSEESVERQFKTLQEMPSHLPAGVACRVCDFEISGLSSGVLVGSKAVLSVMGGYVVFDDAHLVASVQPRIKIAQTRGCPLAEFLEQKFTH